MKHTQKAIAFFSVIAMLAGKVNAIPPTSSDIVIASKATNISQAQEKLDLKLVTRVISAFFQSDRYLTESETLMSGNKNRFGFNLRVQSKTLVESGGKFRSEITFTPPGEKTKLYSLVICDGKQVWIYKCTPILLSAKPASAIGSTLLAQVVENNAEAYNNRAFNRMQSGDIKGAIEDFNQVLKINPNLALAYNNRGFVRMQSGDIKGAIADFNQAIKIDPDLALAYNNRGLARMQSGDIKGAIADFNQAIKINPNLALAYNNRGFVRMQSGDIKGAIADFNQAIKINPNYADAYNNRGGASFMSGDKQNAIADFNQAIKINANYALAYYNRGFVRMQSGDIKGAIADFNQAIKINPNYADAYTNRGLARMQLGDNQNAIADLQKAADLFQQEGKTQDYQDVIAILTKIKSENQKVF
jgi:tetratricopeptide (TPR) repeat protein